MTTGMDSNGDVELLDLAAVLDAIARGADSVDPEVPILCGMAADQLYATCGVTTMFLPHVADDPAALVGVLECVASALEMLRPEPDSSVVSAAMRVRQALQVLRRTT